MAKSLKGAAAAKLIQDATSAPGVFVFSELLELPNIQELGKSEQHQRFLSLLQLFSYKTYQDYVALDMPTIRELEDLIIDAIYLDILRGKLDEKEQQLEVEYTMGRDLEPGKLEELLAALQNWAETTTAVLGTLEAKIQQISRETTAAKQMEQEQESLLQANLKEVFEKQKDKSLGGGMMNRRGMHMGIPDRDPMHMDVDEPPEGLKNKNRK
ncbi:hypothetical protein H0H81_006360 [Sphagnurus paluster]|uniref:PCI domain-containing protein n=1 Tax=Sphagnurus paluster TaxID=117069 RepID=A0A9P7FY17_9AGAR|nr:hypothetical protein H0H81_006360 [Sphagnurus paluster]